VYDLVDDALGKMTGCYDLVGDTGRVSLGIDHARRSFAVASIARWWQYMDQRRYPPKALFITADT
jgi:hypothetical protein